MGEILGSFMFMDNNLQREAVQILFHFEFGFQI